MSRIVLRPATTGRYLGPVLALGLLVGAGAACSDDDSDAGEATTTTAEVVPGPGGDGELVGTWVADADELVGDALVSIGLAEAPPCVGELTLELRDDGTFSRTVAGTCELPEEDGQVELVAEGGYGAEDGVLTLSDVTSSGSLVGESGAELQVPVTDDGDSHVPYTIEGDMLTLGVPEGGEGTSTTLVRA